MGDLGICESLPEFKNKRWMLKQDETTLKRYKKITCSSGSKLSTEIDAFWGNRAQHIGVAKVSNTPPVSQIIIHNWPFTTTWQIVNVSYTK